MEQLKLYGSKYYKLQSTHPGVLLMYSLILHTCLQSLVSCTECACVTMCSTVHEYSQRMYLVSVTSESR